MAELRNKHIRQKIIFSFPAANLSAFQKLEESKTFFTICQKSQHHNCMYILPTALLKHRGQPQAGKTKLKQQRGAWKPSWVILQQEGNGDIADTPLSPGTSASLGTCLREFCWQERRPFLKLLTLFRGHVTPPARNGLGCSSSHVGREILHCPSQYQFF